MDQLSQALAVNQELLVGKLFIQTENLRQTATHETHGQEQVAKIDQSRVLEMILSELQLQ